MKVILLEKVANLGGIGDEVNVKAGFGRNFLLPFGKAVPATAANRVEFETRRADLEKQANDVLVAAEARRDALADKVISITVNASEEGKLFGSVGPREVADALTAMGAEVAKSEVELPEGPIHELGEFDVTVRLHTDVATTVKVQVVAG